MNTSEWIAVASVTVLILGWVVNSCLNRRNNTSNTRIKYRVDVLNAILDIKWKIQRKVEPQNDPTLFPLINETMKQIQLFGKNDEIKLYEEFVKAGDVDSKSKALHELTRLCLKRIRRELDL